MKKVSLLVIALCTCATFYCQKDTRSRNVWGRNVEPRLTSSLEWEPCRKKKAAPDRVVEDTQCGTAETLPASIGACDEITETSSHKQALEALSFEPRCNDAAIGVLERFARVDATAMSDVAAAYYVRAQREDRPADFLRALDAADHAIAAAPELRAARFNRALILEALGLSGPAIAAWNEFLRVADPKWDDEARRHRRRLTQSVGDATHWQRNRDALPDALRLRDRNAVARLIAPFPSAAQRYFEEELLPRWAAAPTREQLERISLFANELSSRLDDPFPTDVVAAIRQASQSPEKLAALQHAHRQFSETRRIEQSFGLKDAAARYKSASDLFKRAASPFHLRVDLGYSANQAAVELLDPIETEAAKHGYHDLRARVLWMQGHFTEQSSYAESLAAYDGAFNHYARINDQEGLAAIRTRRAGVLRGFGAGEVAWREVFYAARNAPHLIDLRHRQALLLEAASIAVSLGYPRAAFLYQTTAIDELRKALKIAPPDEIYRFRQIQLTLAMALRHRAATEVSLGHNDDAINGLSESIRLTNKTRNLDREVQRILRARAYEVRGQLFLHTDPVAAIAEYTNALANATSSFRSFRASLLAQRAEAERRTGRVASADRDLQAALAVLRSEEQAILASRKRGAEEELWSPYFSRFQDTYRLLIRSLIEKGDRALAFTYAERARAVEPLDLLLQLGHASPALPTDAPADEESARARIAQIRESLPPGTFIIEYCVLEDRTYVWIISRDRFEYLMLDQVGREKTNRWSTELQQAAGHRDSAAAERVLIAAYAELAAEPLRVIAKMTGGVKPARLVFIPDGGIHGLPLVALRDRKMGDYLIQRVPIEIAGSAALYDFSLRRDLALPPAKNPSVLVIGDPAFDEHLPLAQGMKRLGYAKREAERIGEVYAPAAEILTGADATVPALLRRASNHAIVHVAGHAIVNAQTPSRSFLLLAPSAGYSGALETEELLKRLKLDQTRLFILSTCSSAGGLPVGPEGVAPFVRPLLAAGVPAVIGSLWDVDDATTEELMVSFHRHYQKGSDAAVAMRDAQLGLLNHKNAGLRSVLAWAPFQVIGHASPYAARAPSNGGTQIGIHSSNSVQRSDRLRPQ